MSKKKVLSAKEQAALLGTLEQRFADNMQRHKGIAWQDVLARLKCSADKLWTLNEMERTGGEPDVTGYDKKTGAYLYCDCSAESPEGRRSLCYDRAALDARKANKPADSAVDMATAMGIELLTEEQYRKLQETGAYDLKTSSWVATPDTIRQHGGAIFCDRRYDHVFLYHNGASSYYAARGFRGMLKV